MILSLQLLSVIKNDVKIRPILINSEFILFIMKLLNSRYAYSILNLKFWSTSLWHCTIHFKIIFWEVNDTIKIYAHVYDIYVNKIYFLSAYVVKIMYDKSKYDCVNQSWKIVSKNRKWNFSGRMTSLLWSFNSFLFQWSLDDKLTFEP